LINNEDRHIKINGVGSLLGFRLLFLFIYLPNAPLFSPSPSFTHFSLLLHFSNQTKTLERETTSKLPKMLLGKRPRPPMKRTTSMSEITLDLNAAAADAAVQRRSGASGGADGGALTPKIFRRHSSDLVDTPHFLRACALCKSCLAPGRDIYMYRFNSVAFPTVLVNSIIFLFINSEFLLLIFIWIIGMVFFFFFFFFFLGVMFFFFFFWFFINM